ncbi:MAG: methionyl-tRNA formyltransferase [Rhodospirillales bacterium]|nr:methionyl-tRNA formyltransferase [Rhodospirillales bacterium]
MTSLRTVFMGTPAFAVPILSAFLDAGHDVVCVYTQPPRQAGRGHREQPSPVHAFAAERSIPVCTPKSLKTAAAGDDFKALAADVAVVAAYGLILPQAVLAAPRLGCINVHASLLPRWRGAAPIQRAILAGDTETGVTIMQMDEGLDTGPMLLSRAVAIGERTTASALHDNLSRVGSELIVEALAGIAAGTLTARPQPAVGVTYAHKLERHEGRLDWSRPAAELERTVRALNPWPGTWFEHDGERIRIHEAEIVPRSGAPGTILDDRLAIACGCDALRPLRLQRSGRSPLDCDAFLRGYPMPPGRRLDAGNGDG